MRNEHIQSVSNGDNNIIAGGDVNITKLINNDIHVEIYEQDIKVVIEQFTRHKELFDRNNHGTPIFEGEYDFTEKEKKNQINNLGLDYFEMMKDDLLPYFFKIDSFLTDPQNKDLLNQYKDSAIILKMWIITNRNNYNKFEDVLMHISEQLINASDVAHKINPLIVTVMLNYMYWNCDIGKRA